jgi:hypothetical protein
MNQLQLHSSNKEDLFTFDFVGLCTQSSFKNNKFYHQVKCNWI